MNTHDIIASRISRQSGSSMVEVLVSIVVLGIGLLGLVQMQAASLANNQSAYKKSQAAVLTYDIADRMRANPGSIDSYLTSSMTLEEATTEGQQSSCKNQDGCSTTELSQDDLRDWHAALTTALPGAIGIITLADDIYTISVSWDENRDGAIDAGDPDVRMSFLP